MIRAYCVTFEGMSRNIFEFQNIQVIEWCNFKLSVEIEIKEGFERSPRVSATLRLFRK